MLQATVRPHHPAVWTFFATEPNEMTAQSVVTARHDYAVSGVGYEPTGLFTLDGAEVHPEDHPVLAEMTRAALLCNDAELREEEGGLVMDGDPTEGALLVLSLKAGRSSRS